jgi:hypothetical protein
MYWVVNPVGPKWVGALFYIFCWSAHNCISCGKTTLARLIATQTDAVFKELSATSAGINDVRAVVEAAKTTLSLTGRCAAEQFFVSVIHFIRQKNGLILGRECVGHSLCSRTC